MKRICRTPPRCCSSGRLQLSTLAKKKPALLVSPDAKARLAAPITEAQIRLAQGFLRELDPDMSDLHNLQQRYNDLFLPEDGVHWLH